MNVQMTNRMQEM